MRFFALISATAFPGFLFRRGAIHNKTLPVPGIINKINLSPLQISDRFIVHDNLDPIGNERQVIFANLIVQSHPELHGTAATTGDENS
jgi:hypothetical protein